MTTTAKVTATTLGAGGAVVVGCYAGGVFNGESATIVNATSLIDILWSPLNKDTNFSATYNTENTVGKEYGQYLTGTETENQKWWEESYKTYDQDTKATDNTRTFSDLFSHTNNKVTLAYSANVNTALNKVCEEAYKKNLTNEVDFTSASGTEDKHRLAADILRYCSPLKQKPIIIQANDNTYSEGKIGKQGHEKKLVSVSEESNDGFWKAQNEWFKERGKSSTALDNYFNQFFETTKTLKADKNIKQICEEAYTKAAVTEATTSQPKIDDVVKYCSFKKLSENS